MTGPNYRAYIAKTYGPGHRLFLSWDDWSKRTALGVTVCVATGFTFDEHPEGAALEYEGGIKNADGLIQAVMDEAWERGFRPAGFKDVRNETAAIRDHLNDMRALVGHETGAPLKDRE